MALPGEVNDLKANLIFFGSGCLVHFWPPFGSLCGFKALIGPYLGSSEPHNFVRVCFFLKVISCLFFVRRFGIIVEAYVKNLCSHIPGVKQKSLELNLALINRSFKSLKSSEILHW